MRRIGSRLMRIRHICPHYNPSENPYTPDFTMDYLINSVTETFEDSFRFFLTYSLNREIVVWSIGECKVLVWDDALVQLLSTLTDCLHLFNPLFSNENTAEPCNALVNIMCYVICEQAIINGNFDLASSLSVGIRKVGLAFATHAHMQSKSRYHEQILSLATISIAVHELTHVGYANSADVEKFAPICAYALDYCIFEYEQKLRFPFYDGLMPHIDDEDAKLRAIDLIERPVIACIENEAFREEFLADIVSSLKILEGNVLPEKDWKEAYRNMLMAEFIVSSAHQIVNTARQISDVSFDENTACAPGGNLVDPFQIARWRVRLTASFLFLLGTDEFGRIKPPEGGFESHARFSDVSDVITDIEVVMRNFDAAKNAALPRMIAMRNSCMETGKHARMSQHVPRETFEEMPLHILGWI